MHGGFDHESASYTGQIPYMPQGPLALGVGHLILRLSNPTIASWPLPLPSIGLQKNT